MKDLLLNSNQDLTLVNFDLVLTDETNITAQKIKQALLLFKNEWFLNNDVGLPYFEEIFGKNNSISRIETLYIREISKIEEIAEITKLDLSLDNATRELSVSLEVRDFNNNNLIVEI